MQPDVLVSTSPHVQAPTRDGSSARSDRLVLAVTMALALVGVAGGCTDPIHDGAVKTLGGEKSNIPKGEFHRAGQPCVVCHQESGPASSVFSAGGTIFDTATSLVGVGDVEVQLVDSTTNKAWRVKTNCVGNFFVKKSDWNPQFPVLVHLVYNNATVEMTSPIGQEPSCANCHASTLEPANPAAQVGHIYVGSPANPNAACDYPADLGAQ